MKTTNIDRIIAKERIVEVLHDCNQFFENGFTGKIEINFLQGNIAAVNVTIYKKGNKYNQIK